MALEIVAMFLSEVVRLLSGSALWCAVAQIANATFGVTQTTYLIPPTSIVTIPVRYVAAVGEGPQVTTFRVGSGRDRAFYREIARVGPAGMGEPMQVRIPATPDSNFTSALRGSDGFVASEKNWWYATLDFRDGAAATTFAERLPDGRIALFSIAEGLSMLLLSDQGDVKATVLRNVRIQQFDTAIDDAGRIAVATARKAEPIIEAAVIDPANPETAEWHSLRHDVGVMGLLRELQVVTTPDGYAAAWINESAGRRIEATQLDLRGRGGPVFEVGQTSPRGMTAFFDVQATQDELLFWWEDGEHLFQRRLPRSLTGLTLLHHLTQRFCSNGEPLAGPAEGHTRP